MNTICLSQVLQLIYQLMSLDQFDNLSEDIPLPFGKQVYSQAYDVYESVLLPPNQKQPLTSLQDTIKSVKKILSDKALTQSQKIHQSLKIIQQQTLSPEYIKTESKDKQQQPQNSQQQKVQLKDEPTIKIELRSQESIEVQAQKGKNYKQRLMLINENDHERQEIKVNFQQLKRQLYSKDNQILLLKKEKRQNQLRLQRQIERLTSKLQQVGTQNCESKKSIKKQDNNQQMAKMNKWLETLNKLLQGAQRQASVSKDQLKKIQQLSAKQLKQKQQEIRFLHQQIKLLKKNNMRQDKQIYSFIRQALSFKINAAQKENLKEEIIHFIQFST